MKNKWQYTISFSHFWNAEIPIEEKGKAAAKEVSKLQRYFEGDFDLEDITNGFDSICGDDQDYTLVEDFDDRMRELYDWADYHKVWVNTSCK